MADKKETHDKVTHDIEDGKFRDRYKTAIKGISELEHTIENANTSYRTKNRMRTTILACKSVLERQLAMPPRKELGAKICAGCGAVLKDEKEWQFCPICGQRFRDAWEE